MAEGTLGTGKFSTAFSTAKAVFDVVKKPEVQQRLIAASKNEAVRSAISSLAKNEAVRKVTLNALQDEKTLKTAYDIAQACDKQQQQKRLVKKDSIPADKFVNHAGTSKSIVNKAPTSVYPSLPPSQDYASDINSKTADKFAVMPSQSISYDIFQSNFASEANAFMTTNQEQQPYGYAKFQFLASHFDELSAEPSDMIVLEKKVDDQWVYALNKRTGQKGIMPLLYIDVKIPLPTSLTSSTSQIPYRVIALYDFDSSVSGDLTFRANDEIYVVEKINDDWLCGKIGVRQGIFPANYVREITVPLTAPSEPISCYTSAEYISALYDYNSDVEGDLIFKAGDQIEVLEWVNEDWLRGKLNGKIGLVPRTYIENCSSKIDAGKHLNITNTIVTAKNDYYNNAKDHLCFSRGDQIEVIEEIDGNWLKGKLLLNMSNTKSFPVGLFPKSAIL
ncbi:SH3 domain family protein [Brugia pahangi]